MNNKPKILLTSVIVVILLFGFAVPVNMVGNWYQQFMPNIGNRQIQDITFLDSLTGYATARQTSDTSYVLRTTNGGDNWEIIYRNFLAMTQIQFINVNTGYCCGAYLFKTTNGGIFWSQVTAPAISPDELFILNEDTIWIISNNSLTGGVFRTTNAGASWTRQGNYGSSNPSHIYMYNARIGFIDGLRKTTNGGENWTFIPGETSVFWNMFFSDSLTGWKTSGTMKKTVNGGLNWTAQTLPIGGMIITSQVNKFSNVNKDTIWGCGGWAHYPNGQDRGILYKTTNGGDSWLFQIPDSAIHIFQHFHIQFLNKFTGWSYGGLSGIHTTNGGDTTFLTGIREVSNETPKEIRLYQNYPNPFNPKTVISYQLRVNSYVKMAVFDVTGKHVIDLVNQKQTAGTYEVDFSGNGLSSGVYVYTLRAGEYTETRKMVLVK